MLVDWGLEVLQGFCGVHWIDHLSNCCTRNHWQCSYLHTRVIACVLFVLELISSPIDVVFVLDASSTLSQSDFDAVKCMLKKLVYMLDVRYNKVCGQCQVS